MFKIEIRHKKKGVSAVLRQPRPRALAQEAHEGLATIKRRGKTLISTVARLLQYRTATAAPPWCPPLAAGDELRLPLPADWREEESLGGVRPKEKKKGEGKGEGSPASVGVLRRFVEGNLRSCRLDV